MYKRKSQEKYLNQRDIYTRNYMAPIFVTEQPKCEAYRRSIIYKGSVEWNNLPPEIRNIPTYDAFKYVQKHGLNRQ